MGISHSRCKGFVNFFDVFLEFGVRFKGDTGSGTDNLDLPVGDAEQLGQDVALDSVGVQQPHQGATGAVVGVSVLTLLVQVGGIHLKVGADRFLYF